MFERVLVTLESLVNKTSPINILCFIYIISLTRWGVAARTVVEDEQEVKFSTNSCLSGGTRPSSRQRESDKGKEVRRSHGSLFMNSFNLEGINTTRFFKTNWVLSSKTLLEGCWGVGNMLLIHLAEHIIPYISLFTDARFLIGFYTQFLLIRWIST